MYVLLTGPPGIGKSTVLDSFANTFNHRDLSGILASEVRDEKGKRVGFKTTTYPQLTERTFAHKVCIDSLVKVGSYKVSIQDLDESMEEALQTQGSVFLLDEIGRMQSHSKVFINSAKKLFKEKPDMFVVGTIVYDDELFARYFKYMKDVLIITVTEKNRNFLVLFLKLLFRMQIPRTKWCEFIEKVKPHLMAGNISHAMALANLMR
ncbi:MAG: nucleoside-triphosphatase THEP1 [Candidatus Paceibacteria bacterium]|jgi:nucleoside-triphosphatase THEP1